MVISFADVELGVAEGNRRHVTCNWRFGAERFCGFRVLETHGIGPIGNVRNHEESVLLSSASYASGIIKVLWIFRKFLRKAELFQPYTNLSLRLDIETTFWTLRNDSKIPYRSCCKFVQRSCPWCQAVLEVWFEACDLQVSQCLNSLKMVWKCCLCFIPSTDIT